MSNNTWACVVSLHLETLFWEKKLNLLLTQEYDLSSIKSCELLDVMILDWVINWKESSLYWANTQETSVRVSTSAQGLWRMIGSLNQHDELTSIYVLVWEMKWSNFNNHNNYYYCYHYYLIFFFFLSCWNSSKGSNNKWMSLNYKIKNILTLNWNALQK